MIATVLAVAALGSAPDYLTTVTSPVFDAPGRTAAQLAATANICMAQTLASGQEGGQLIVSSDPATGVVVSNNRMEYRDGLLMWQVRSRLTFEGRDGRFRLVHNGIERFNDQGGGWTGIGKWRGAGWQKAEAAYTAISERVASCVLSQGEAGDDW